MNGKRAAIVAYNIAEFLAQEGAPQTALIDVFFRPALVDAYWCARRHPRLIEARQGKQWGPFGLMGDSSDPKRLVAMGYDQIADEYLARYSSSSVRDRSLSELTTLVSEQGSARVLDLGCGAGIPVAPRLTALGHHVLGVDGSARQIALARRNAPLAEFIHADMTTIDLPAASFDAVAAFYSITHVPRSEHARLLRQIAEWLRPGGVFVGSLGAGSLPDWEGEWMGTEMFFSHYDAATNIVLLREAGFAIERMEEIDEDNEDGRFLWIVARRPTASTWVCR
jgi:SAM-dependent methyltransferase